MDNNKVAVVCIARMEGRYIVEWVEHYKNLGFDKAIICDNNFGDEEHYDELLKGYINQGFVIIEDVRDKPGFQMKCYSIIYDKYKNDFSWMLMCDVDEFLTFTKDKDVKEFLSRFPDDAEVVVANWAQYGDNGQIYADYSRPVQERFTEPRPNAMSQYNFVDDCHIKSFVKGGLPNVVWYSNPHIPTNPLVCYNAKGERCQDSPFQPVDHSVAYFKHYTTKSLEEYCTTKLRRGTADRPYDVFLKTYVNRFFRINEVTPEKLAYLDRNGIKGI